LPFKPQTRRQNEHPAKARDYPTKIAGHALSSDVHPNSSDDYPLWLDKKTKSSDVHSLSSDDPQLSSDDYPLSLDEHPTKIETPAFGLRVASSSGRGNSPYLVLT